MSATYTADGIPSLERLHAFARHLSRDPHVVITIEQEHDEDASWWCVRCVAFTVGRGRTLAIAVGECFADAEARVAKQMKDAESSLAVLKSLLEVSP